MALLTSQSAVAAGTLLSFAAATAAGDTFVLDGRTALYVKNGSAASINVTISSQKAAVPGLAPSDNVVAIPAGSERIIAVDQGAFTNVSQGAALIAYSAATSVTVAAVRI